MAVRVIVFMGVATFLFLMLMAFGLRKSLAPAGGVRVAPGAGESPFSASRTVLDLDGFSNLPDGAAYASAFDAALVRGFRMSGTRVKPLRAERAGEPLAQVGVVEGDRPGIIVVAVEAGAAEGAWLLELGRALGKHRSGRTLWLLGLPPGRAPLIAPVLASGDSENRVELVVALAGLGDCLLGIQRDGDSSQGVTEILWNTARRLGYDEVFNRLPSPPRESYAPLRDTGLPVVSLADSRADETGGAPCPESLRAVGDVIYHALAPIEGHLDGTGTRDDGH